MAIIVFSGWRSALVAMAAVQHLIPVIWLWMRDNPAESVSNLQFEGARGDGKQRAMRAAISARCRFRRSPKCSRRPFLDFERVLFICGVTANGLIVRTLYRTPSREHPATDRGDRRGIMGGASFIGTTFQGLVDRAIRAKFSRWFTDCALIAFYLPFVNESTALFALR